MFRVRVKNERLWAQLREAPVLNRLVRLDMQAISLMKDPETIDRAFSDIDLLSGVSKQTNKDRFASVDGLSLQHIENRSLSRIHDVGVSSGITSLELRRQLAAVGFSGDMFISDKFARFYINRRWLSTDVYDAERKLVCAYCGPFVGDSEDTWKFPVSKYLYRRAAGRSFDDSARQDFLLLHPDVLEAIEEGLLHFIDYDAFRDEQENAFDFVRCMNLLNRGYFPTESLENGLRALYRSLTVGGILQIGRTHLDGDNHVSFYEKAAGGFQPVDSVGDGSEIDQLVVDFSDTSS